MNDDGAGIGLLVLLVGGLWAYFGAPMRDIRSWTGNATYEDQLGELTDHVKKRKIGVTQDYWLTKNSLAGQPDRVALVFGLWGDLEFCQDLANLYMSKFPNSTYYCLAANTE